MGVSRFSIYRQVLNQASWNDGWGESWAIAEDDACASFKHLDLSFKGDLLTLEKSSYKQIYGKINNQLTSKIEDLDCDGFAFYLSGEDEGKKAIVAVELKSGFDSNDLVHAYKQVVYTYLKIHSLLSLCDGYNCLDYTFVGVIACHPPKDVELYVAKITELKNSGKLPKDIRFMDTMYQANSKCACKSITLSQVHFLEDFPLHPDLQQQKLHLYLHLTEASDDTHSTLDLHNVLKGIRP